MPFRNRTHVNVRLLVDGLQNSRFFPHFFVASDESSSKVAAQSLA
jgi:hypothetical protein